MIVLFVKMAAGSKWSDCVTTSNVTNGSKKWIRAQAAFGERESCAASFWTFCFTRRKASQLLTQTKRTRGIPVNKALRRARTKCSQRRA